MGLFDNNRGIFQQRKFVPGGIKDWLGDWGGSFKNLFNKIKGCKGKYGTGQCGIEQEAMPTQQPMMMPYNQPQEEIDYGYDLPQDLVTGGGMGLENNPSVQEPLNNAYSSQGYN